MKKLSNLNVMCTTQNFLVKTLIHSIRRNRSLERIHKDTLYVEQNRKQYFLPDILNLFQGFNLFLLGRLNKITELPRFFLRKYKSRCNGGVNNKSNSKLNLFGDLTSVNIFDKMTGSKNIFGGVSFFS